MNANDALAGTSALVVSLILVPLVSVGCKRFDLLDHPGPLKIHTHPVPRLGGIAIAAAVVAGVFVGRTAALEHWPVLEAFALLWLVGLIDDLRGLPPLPRLAAQAFSGLLLWYSGFGIPAHDRILGLAETVSIVVLFVNAWNMLDGADGLAAGVAAIAALAFFLRPASCGGSLGAFACALAGSCAGFLVFNLPPADIYLGDSGSTSLGLALAVLTLDFYRSNDASPAVIVFPLLVAALPLVDGVFALIRRLRKAQSPLRGDRLHMYDLARERGLSARQVALASYALTFLFAVLGVLALRYRPMLVLPIGVLTAITLVVLAVWLGCFSLDQTASLQIRSKSARGQT